MVTSKATPVPPLGLSGRRAQATTNATLEIMNRRSPGAIRPVRDARGTEDIRWSAMPPAQSVLAKPNIAQNAKAEPPAAAAARKQDSEATTQSENSRASTVVSRVAVGRA